MSSTQKYIAKSLARIADTLEQMAAKSAANHNFSQADAFVWNPKNQSLRAVQTVNRIDLMLFQGIDHVKNIVIQNTLQFAHGYAANNALLWGARGMGKSSLIKAVHAQINQQPDFLNRPLKLIEIHREDIVSLPDLMTILASQPHKFLLFCDDLSFDSDDTSYKALKAILDGGIEGRPSNTLLYATSNRRHLMPRDMIENERSTAINPSESVEEKVSLSDRFGLWLGFHKCTQECYLSMIEHYIHYFGIPSAEDEWRTEALEWAMTRGYRSGRTAWQFIQDLAGRKKISLYHE